jgi:hypothetical protein
VRQALSLVCPSRPAGAGLAWFVPERNGGTSAGPLAASERTTNPGVPLKTCPVGAPPRMPATSGALLMGLAPG